MNARSARFLFIVYMTAIFIFLYFPIVVLVVFSFNESKLNAVWAGFTPEWYVKLLHNQGVMEAAKNSLIVAFLSTVISTFIGTLAGVAMYRYQLRAQSALDTLVFLPLVIPEIVMGVSLLAFFTLLNIPLGLFTLVAAHVTFSIPLAIVIIRTRLHAFDLSVEEAALDLGANEWQTLRYIILPIIMPGVLASALLAFTLSIDDVIVSFFVAGPGSTTLPLKILSMVKFGVSPEINALSTVMLVITLGIVAMAERIRFKKGKD